MEKVKIRLLSPSGAEDIVEIPKDLFDRFSKRAEELEVPVDELFRIALDNFLKSEGY